MKANECRWRLNGKIPHALPIAVEMSFSLKIITSETILTYSILLLFHPTHCHWEPYIHPLDHSFCHRFRHFWNSFAKRFCRCSKNYWQKYGFTNFPVMIITVLI